MSYKRLTFLAPLLVFALLLLQITPGDAKKCDIWNRDVDESGSKDCKPKPAKCAFWIQGLRDFQNAWSDARHVMVVFAKADNENRRLEAYHAVKSNMDRLMDGYGCAHLGKCADRWRSLKKAVEGGQNTHDIYQEFQRVCDQNVAFLVECSTSWFQKLEICDNCECKKRMH